MRVNRKDRKEDDILFYLPIITNVAPVRKHTRKLYAKVSEDCRNVLSQQ